jgi:hypothetical protein
MTVNPYTGSSSIALVGHQVLPVMGSERTARSVEPMALSAEAPISLNRETRVLRWKHTRAIGCRPQLRIFHSLLPPEWTVEGHVLRSIGFTPALASVERRGPPLALAGFPGGAASFAA